MALTIPLNDVSGVAKGSTTTVRIQKGWTYHELFLSVKGMKITDIGQIRVMINGQPVRRYRSLVELLKYNQYDGIDSEHDLSVVGDPEAAQGAKDTAIGNLPDEFTFSLVFDRANMRTRIGEQMTAIGTGTGYDAEKNPFPVNNFVVELDIKDTTTVVSPSMDITAEVSQPSPTGFIVKTRNYEYDPTGAGEFQIGDLSKFGRINRIFLTADKNAAIDKVKIERDTYKVFERTDKLARKVFKRLSNPYAGKLPADIYAINPTEKGFSDEGLAVLYSNGQPVQDFRLILDMAKQCHLSVTVEYFTMLGA
jgi:hypothetical protein